MNNVAQPIKHTKLFVRPAITPPVKPDYSTWMQEIHTEVNNSKGIKK